MSYFSNATLLIRLISLSPYLPSLLDATIELLPIHDPVLLSPTTVIRYDTTLHSYGPGSVQVITCHHTDYDTSLLALEDAAGNLGMG